MSAITSSSNHITTSTKSHASATSSCSNPSTSATSNPSSPPSASSSACAACKYQRRKCTSECALAPYFPADNQRQFLNAHRLFGVSNMQKILKSVHSDYRHDAMRSIILQSNIRAQDPVGGCQRQIINLTQHINAALAELMSVRKKIAEIKAQLDASPSINPNLHLLPSPDASLAYDHQYQHQPQLLQQYLNNQFYDPMLQEVGHGSHEFSSQNDVQFNFNVNSQGLQMEQEPFPKAEEESFHPFLDLSQMSHSFQIGEYGDSKNAAASSSATFAAHPFSYKNEGYVDSNLVMQVQENELRNAASLFTLTNNSSRDTI